MADQQSAGGLKAELTHQEHLSLHQRLRPSAALLYEIVRREGDRELARPAASLFWSGIAAGLSISMSVVAIGTLVALMPDVGWASLITSFGYSFGFLFVILGRQQLFTENTLTAVLPVMAAPRLPVLARMGRLWAIVLVGNVLGAGAAGAALATLPLVPPDVHLGIADASRHLFELDAAGMFWRGIIAGWLVATLVWVLPAAEDNAPLMIILITYLMAVGDLTHVIVGSVEAAFLISMGEISAVDGAFRFFLPTLAGNILGGTALFAVLSYAQVREEMTDNAPDAG